MPYHSTKKQMEKTKKTDRSKILKNSSTGRRRMTSQEKKILAEHNKDVKHTKAQRFEMVKAITSSQIKYDTKKKIQDLHKKLFGK